MSSKTLSPFFTGEAEDTGGGGGGRGAAGRGGGRGAAGVGGGGGADGETAELLRFMDGLLH